MCSYKDGRTALMKAANEGHHELVSVLLVARGDLNLQDKVSTRIGCVCKHILEHISIDNSNNSQI